ncbi:MAG: outer membrane lipoprotein carrier protein LolA [Acidobacteria bacterium]|jgi:outer membrane lipoprotein carrier protein|nr:outer membrane lipoprotein carrier protein LolA [Acidobacteriota bacterium]
MSTALLLALLLAAGSAAPADDTAPGLAESLVARIEKRHARTTDLVARFEQTYRSGLLGRALVERGVVSIKRPGRMRWEYREPEKKLFLSDGKAFYFYVPEDKQVIVQEQDDRRSLAGRLLFGEGGLLDEFEASLEEPLEEGILRVRLTPRREDAELERAYVDVEPSGVVRSIVIDDIQGNRTRFRFEELKENTGLKDDLFHFEVPSGVEVIRG